MATGSLFTDDAMTCKASFDEARVYRYSLERWWNFDGFRCVWVMLNPSTADEHVEDPTIRRCMSFAKSWGAGGIEVVNLFALRATNPSELYRCADPIGSENDAAISTALTRAGRIVVAWGAHGDYRSRGQQVRRIAEAVAQPLWCLGRNNDGTPKHPLYIAKSKPLERF